jgi:hypothetical protein
MRIEAADPAGVVARVEQSRAELCGLDTLIAQFAVWKLLVLGRGRAQVGNRVRERRLLAEQQEQGEQQVHYGTADVHGGGS